MAKGVPSGQITKLKTKVDEWVSKGGLSAINLLSSEQAKARLHTLDAQFKWYHIDVIDALDDDEEIEREGDVMEEHEGKMVNIIISLKSISSSAPTTSSETTALVKTESKELEVLWRCLADLEINVWRINSKITTVMPGPSMDRCLLEHCNRQITSFEMEMFDISRTIATMEDTKELNDEKLRISDVIFNLGLIITFFTNKKLKRQLWADAVTVICLGRLVFNNSY